MSRQKKKNDREYIYPAKGDDVSCPKCGRPCKVIAYWTQGERGRTVFLDSDSRRYPERSLPLALEHGVKGAPCRLEQRAP